MKATAHHTSLTMHMLKDKQVVQLKEATLVRILMCPTSIVTSTCGRERRWLVNEGNASTLSQLHANEMVHHLHVNEYGNLSNLPDLRARLTFRSDPITILELR